MIFFTQAGSGRGVFIFTRRARRGQQFFVSYRKNLRECTWEELCQREARVAARRMLFPAVVVGPPVSPGCGVLAERSTGDGFERRANQTLRGGVWFALRSKPSPVLL